MSESWAARARHARSAVGNQGGLDWGDFGIGAAAMLGLVLLVTGLAAGAHYSRKCGIRPRPASQNAGAESPAGALSLVAAPAG